MTSKHAPAPGTRSTTITGTVHPGHATELVFEWNPADPLAIHLTAAQDGHDPVEWVFARDLLIDYYTHGWAGEGDLRLYTDDGDPAKPDTSTIHFSSPDGEAWVELPQPTLRAFAHQMRETAQRHADTETARIVAAADAVIAELCGGS